jgi:GTP-binding protein Era
MHEMNRRMVETATRSIGQGDVVLWLAEVQERPGPGDRFIEGLLRKAGLPVVLALNKIDRVERPRILPAIEAWRHVGSFAEIVPVSALKGDNVDRLEGVLLDRLPGGAALYPEDFLTDLPAARGRDGAGNPQPRARILRTGSRDEQFKEGARPHQTTILVEREQKGVLIPGGLMLKTIGTEARQQIEASSARRCSSASSSGAGALARVRRCSGDGAGEGRPRPGPPGQRRAPRPSRAVAIVSGGCRFRDSPPLP